jgi:alcohol oxidase
VASIVHPVFYLQNLLPTTKTALFYKGNKSKQLADREPIVPSGGTLGGGSSINFMMYTRAQRSDFDSWKTPGWSADEMVPFMKRLETYHGPGEKGTHGYDGPIHVAIVPKPQKTTSSAPAHKSDTPRSTTCRT